MRRRVSTARLVRTAATLGLAGLLLVAGACSRPGSGNGVTPTAAPTVRIGGSPSPVRAATRAASPSPVAPAAVPTPVATPTTAPAPTPTRATGTVPGMRYVVQPGDTLVSIAEEFGVTVEELIEANRLSNPDVLQVGQELIIPGR